MTKPADAARGKDPYLEEAALINPVREAGEAPVAARVLLTFARPDFQFLCQLTQAASPRYIFNCAVCQGRWQEQAVTVVAPALGAPYAAMVLEKLIALGARMALVLGWCGSLQPQVAVGSLVLPTAALGQDGTSSHYLAAGDVGPDSRLYDLLQGILATSGASWHAGRILTHDAFFRETPSLVQQFQGLGLLGIEMELAALLAVGRYRQVPVAALMAVSDELAALTWRPAGRSPQFRQARETAARVLLAAAAGWDDGRD
jgi:uridine phosphorylase